MVFKTDIHSVSDARRLAQKRLPWMVFDYIDGAAGDGFGEQANRDAIRALRLQPRVLNNVEQRDVGGSVFAQQSALSFGVSPMGMCNLAAPKADLTLAKLAAKHAMPVGVSTASSTSLETMMDVSQGNAWFQLYFSGNEEASHALITRAKDAGYKTLILTVDVPEVGRRPRELRRGFKMPFKIGPKQFIDFACHPQWSLSTLFHGKPELANFGGEFGAFDRTSSRAGADWDLLAKIRDTWDGNLVVKGVLHPDDAVKMQQMGVDAIQVSSHGGRQLEGSVNAIDALGAIRKAVGAKYPLFYDSGLRSGEDIVKAYAAGADFAFLGRPFSYAIAAGGARGLDQLVDVLAQEVSITLAQLGVTDMAALNKTHIVKQE